MCSSSANLRAADIGVSMSPISSAYNGTTSYSRASLRASGRLGVRLLPVAFIEYARHLSHAHATLLQQDQEMVEKIRRLLGEPVVLERRHDDLDRLLADLLGCIPRAALEKLRRVGALRHLLVAPGYGPGEPREGPAEVRGLPIRACQRGKEATPLAGVAGRTRRLHPVEQRVTVAIEANLDHFLRVATRRSLAPELATGAGVVVSLAGLDGLLDSLAARIGEHQ